MKHGLTWRLLALLLGLMLVAAACGDDGGTEAGGDGDGDGEAADAGEPIVIAGIFDLTGATGDVGTPYSEGVRDYIAWRNAEGGVEGREIELVWQDYQYDVAVAEQLYSQFVGEGAVAILGWGTADTEALRGQIAQDEIPFVSGSYSEELVNPEEAPYNFIVVATYSDQMRIALKYISEETPGADVAVFHNDSPFGTSPVADGQEYAAEAGLGAYESYAMPAGATDYVSELSQAQSRGADWIIVQNVGSPAAQLARNISEQGLDVRMICLNWCASEIIVDLAGDAAEGVLGVMPYTPASGDVPGLEEPRAYLEEQGDSLEDKGTHYVQGWYKAHVLIEGIARVVESGEEVTGPNIKEALETNTFDTGEVTAEVAFSADSHRGVNAAPLYVVEDGTWVQLTDPMEP